MNNLDLLKPNQIIKSKRKSISLIIKTNGDLLVRAPLKSKAEDINKFIKEKANWIIKKRSEQLNHIIKPLTFDSIEEISLLGTNYQIAYNSTVSRAKLIENQIILPKENSKAKLMLFLKNFAKKYLLERVMFVSSMFNLPYLTISITSARTSWGSCSYNNKLHFTYKLIMCPKEVVDYVILHELVHTKIKNHSAKYWTMVKEFCPNYKTYEKWLKENRGIIEMV